MSNSLFLSAAYSHLYTFFCCCCSFLTTLIFPFTKKQEEKEALLETHTYSIGSIEVKRSLWYSRSLKEERKSKVVDCHSLSSNLISVFLESKHNSTVPLVHHEETIWLFITIQTIMSLSKPQTCTKAGKFTKVKQREGKIRGRHVGGCSFAG